MTSSDFSVLILGGGELILRMLSGRPARTCDRELWSLFGYWVEESTDDRVHRAVTMLTQSVRLASATPFSSETANTTISTVRATGVRPLIFPSPQNLARSSSDEEE